MRRSRHGRSETMEGLEARVLLAGMPFETYFPEGFTSDNVNEYVPMTNHGEVEAQFELHARYEVGERDQLLASGTIAPHSRGGVTISEAGRPEDRLVRKDTPYALVLRSTQPISATMSHYDFGSAIGQSFTSKTSTTWSFAEGKKDDSTRDYILVFNPSQSAVDVRMEVYGAGGITVPRTLHLEAERRGGWSMADIAELARGAFSVRITSSAPVVASQSHYEVTTGRGFGTIGTPDGGATAGIVPAIEFEDDFYDVNGDDRSHARFQANSFISILNTNDTGATVTLTFVMDARHGVTPAPVQRVFTIGAASRTTISVRDLGLPSAEHFGVVYRSNAPVTLSGSTYQGMDAIGVGAATVAATEWKFGEGYMRAASAGRAIIEDLYVFNPGSSEVTVTFEFALHTGQTVTASKRIDAHELEDIKIDRFLDLSSLPAQFWYGVRITSSAPVVSSLEHWDGGNGGGFSTFGMPGGTVVDFGSVLTL
jgi:hypothetical protein